MRLPICDLTPRRRPPRVTWSLALLGFAAVLGALGPTPPAFALIGACALPWCVLGPAIEDQWGSPRFAVVCVAAAAVGWGTGAGLWTAITTPIGVASGAHLSLFPRGRVAAGMATWVLELPSFALPGLWLVTLTWAWWPVGPALAAMVVGALAARWLRRADAMAWPALDDAY